MQLVMLLLLLVPAIGNAANCFFLEESEFVHQNSYSNESLKTGKWYQYYLHGRHEIGSGSKIIAGVRIFHDEKGMSDAGIYWKMTISLPQLDVGGQTSIVASDEILRVSRGGADWVDKGFGRSLEGISGNINIMRLAAEVISIEINIKGLERLAEDSSTSGDKVISHRFHLHRINRIDLTPWLGRSTDAETYLQSRRPNSHEQHISSRDWDCKGGYYSK